MEISSRGNGTKTVVRNYDLNSTHGRPVTFLSAGREGGKGRGRLLPSSRELASSMEKSQCVFKALVTIPPYSPHF